MDSRTRTYHFIGSRKIRKNPLGGAREKSREMEKEPLERAREVEGDGKADGRRPKERGVQKTGPRLGGGTSLT